MLLSPDMNEDPQLKLNSLSKLHSITGTAAASVTQLQAQSPKAVNLSRAEQPVLKMPSAETQYVNRLVESVDTLRSSVIFERRPPTMIERPMR